MINESIFIIHILQTSSLNVSKGNYALKEHKHHLNDACELVDRHIIVVVQPQEHYIKQQITHIYLVSIYITQPNKDEMAREHYQKVSPKSHRIFSQESLFLGEQLQLIQAVQAYCLTCLLMA